MATNSWARSFLKQMHRSLVLIFNANNLISHTNILSMDIRNKTIIEIKTDEFIDINIFCIFIKKWLLLFV